MSENKVCNREAQIMHKDFFDRCNEAIERGFYMEAILMEYAAIESRMETLLGVLGMPCNKFIEVHERKKVQISHRISCADSFRRQSAIFEESKLGMKFFQKLDQWIKKRNIYIHGLYKNEMEYSRRLSGLKKLAVDGFEYTNALYNEVNRLKRLVKKCPDAVENMACASGKCDLCYEKERC